MLYQQFKEMQYQIIKKNNKKNFQYNKNKNIKKTKI